MVLTGAGAAAAPAPPPAPAPDTRAAVETDYVDQFLLYQGRVLRAMPRRAAPAPRPPPAVVTRAASGPAAVLGDGDDVALQLDDPAVPAPGAKPRPPPGAPPAPPPPDFASLSPEEAREAWLRRMPVPGHAVSPPMDRSYLDGELLLAFGAECAQRGLTQAAALARRGLRLDAERARIEAAAARFAALGKAAPAPALRAAYLDLRWAVRAAVFRHPAWDVTELIFYTRRDGMVFPDVSSIHLPWVGSPGGDLLTLKVTPDGQPLDPPQSWIGGRLDPGHVRGFDLHFDAHRAVFGWTHGGTDFSRGACRPGHESFRAIGSGWIYELDLKDGGLRQITRGAGVHDAEPCYLPDGRVAFMSNRCRSSVQCNQGQHEVFANLYACSLDGAGLERLNNNANGDYNPRLLDDGRIGYLRWEYNERSLNNPHAFWAMRPDGTYAEPVFGQHLGNPIMHANPRSVPGSALFLLVVSQHYNFERGVLGVLDPARGFRDPEAVRPLLPWTRWPANTGHPTRQEQGWFADPWPLAEDLALCAYDFSYNQYQAAGFGLYLVDGGGNQELLYRAPGLSSHSPRPLRARVCPPRLPRHSQPPPAHGPALSPVGYRNVAGEGRCVLSDVTDGLEGLPADVRPAVLRVSENLVLPYFTQAGQTMYHDPINWTPKRIVGDVPLASDGSAHFRVPADRALYFQLLDRDGREIRRMRSWVSLQPGETRSCSGCHEGRPAVPRPQRVPLAVRRPPVQPTPRVSWGDKPVSFVRDIQPILDRHCVGCHGGLKPAKGLDLREGGARLSAWTAGSGRGADAAISQLRQYGSAVAPLVQILRGPAHARGLRLSDQDWTDLYAWIDLSGPLHDRCSPAYRYTPDGDIAGYLPDPPAATNGLPGQPDQSAPSPYLGRRPGIAFADPVHKVFQRRCASCHANPREVLRPGWVDLQDPARSLILLAPLAKSAGGAGRCAETVFAGAGDADYEAILSALRETVRAAWRDPNDDMLPLVEAGRTPPWVAAAKP